jgi:hypothetical protein
MPTQTSASHILLYSDAFFIRLDLRRPCFWRMDFLTDLDRLDWLGGMEAMLREASKASLLQMAREDQGIK